MKIAKKGERFLTAAERKLDAARRAMKGLRLKKYLQIGTAVNPVRYWLAGVALLVIVGAADYVTGYELPFLVFYFPSIFIVSWSGKRAFAVAMAVACACVSFAVDLAGQHPYPSEMYRYWNLVIWFTAFFSVAALVLRVRWFVDNEKRLNNELRKSLSEIRHLKGLLPICASCKKIRNDNGYWEEIEAYIRTRSDAEFSHGICPGCMEKLYPKIWQSMQEERVESAASSLPKIMIPYP